MEFNIIKQDRIIFASLENGEASIIFVEATNTVTKAAQIHNTTPVCTAALGRTLMATLMLGARIKDENSSVTVTVNGGGPIGKITCVSDGNTVKGTLSVPNIILPARSDGKLDVAAVVGKNGNITVVKDLNMKTPYIGQTDMISGEIAEDFAYYLAKSEQQPSIISLGVLTSGDAVLSAGGTMIMAMPGCSEKTIENLELRSMLLSDISKELCYESAESLINKWFEGMNPEIISTRPIEYKCNCSRSRMESALISLGKKELQEILDDDEESVEMQCHFCHKKHIFSKEDIKNLLQKAVEK